MPVDFGFVAEKDFGFQPSAEPDDSGYPSGMPDAERKRLDLLTEQQSTRAQGDVLDAQAQDLARQERSLGFFEKPQLGIGNAIGRVAANVAGYGDTYTDSNQIIPEELRLHVPADDKSVIAGVGRFGAGLINSTMENPVQLPAFGGGSLMKLLATTPMAKDLPEQLQHAWEVVNNPKSTKADIAEAVSAPAATSAFLGLAAHSPALKPVMPPELSTMTPEAAAANRAAVNLASPGTVREGEIQRIGPPAEADVPPMFQTGDIPFQNLRRFGSSPLPPVEVLPQMGRLSEPTILEETRTPQELETRGKVSFGAEAPTLVRNAVEAGDAAGLTRSVEALKVTDRRVTAQEAVPAPAPRPFFDRAAEAEGLGRPSLAPTIEDIRAARAAEARGEQNASRQPITESVPQPEVRPPVGEGTPLRQPGQAPEVQASTAIQEAQDQVAAPKSVQEVIKSVEELPTQEAGALKQKPAVEAGMNLSEADVPALEKARDDALKVAMDAAEKGDNETFKAAFGRNIWYSGAIEGARRKGANFEQVIRESGVPKEGEIPNAPKTEPAQLHSGQPAVAAEGAGPKVETDVQAPDIISRLESLKVSQDVGGQLRTNPFKDIPVALWNGALDSAILAVKAGRTAAQAIDLAISHIKKQVSKFDEDAVRKHFNYVLSNEAKSAAENGTQVAKAAPNATSTPQGINPAAPGTPAPAPAGTVTLADVYKRFEPAPKTGTPLKQKVIEAVESFRTGFSSKFRPLNKLAQDIAKQYGGTAKDIAGIFEQLKGSSGKAEADVIRFDTAVSEAVAGKEKDFNAYMFLRRSLDRLAQDKTDAAAGLPVRRKVSTYTAPDLQAKLDLLESNMGPEQTAKFKQAADDFQQHMNTALKLQVDSGRMSPEVYQAIKDGNQFYAPFKVMKYIEESSRPEGSGRRIDTSADYVKAMEGIESPDFKLGDILGAARQNITMSRILAEKNMAMRQLAELSGIDTKGDFIFKVPKGAEAPKGFDLVNVLENGEPQRYAVNSDVAQAVQSSPASGNVLLRYAGNVFRTGATGMNIPFQAGNLLVDQMRATLVSKYGINNIKTLINYPMDFIESLTTAIQGSVTKNLEQSTIPDVIGQTISPQFGNIFPTTMNRLYLDFLDSGAAGATVQEYLTPDVFTPKPNKLGNVQNVLNTLPDIAKAIEETSKILGIKRAMDTHNMPSGEALARQVPEAITEVRRFSGSPDFGRMGKWIEAAKLNVMYMFLNARIQGAVADMGRLTGRDGAGMASKTWLKMGAAVGLPTAYLYALNNSDKYRKDYEQRPQQEKQNYWLIPKDTFIKGQGGEQIRDYWRIPKREIAQWFANATESGLDFARKRDARAFGNWAQNTLESISPVNIQGKNAQERVESVGGSLNPLIKAPLEIASGRDMYRHQPIVPDTMKKASPELQFKDNTSEVFKTLADKMPDVAPEVFRSPLMLENMTKNMTAGLITQFIPGKKVEGRTEGEQNPLLRRFQAVPYTDSTQFDQRIQKFEREAADTQLTRFRNAQEIVDADKEAKPAEMVKAAIEKYGRDPKLVERIVDVYLANQRGITGQERRILNLPTDQRAAFINDELKGKTPEEKAAIIRNYSLKRILTGNVANAMALESK